MDSRTREKNKWSFQASPNEQQEGINKILAQIFFMQRLRVVFIGHQYKIIQNKRSRDNLMLGLLLAACAL